MKKIIIVYKGQFEKAVPIMTISQVFNSIGVNTKVVCSSFSDDIEKKKFIQEGIEIIELIPGFTEPMSKVKVAQHWIQFRNKFWIKYKNFDGIFYIGSGDTALCLGTKLTKYDYFLHLRELYDQQRFYLKNLKKYAHKAIQNITPEINRAYIYKVFWQLKDLPFVIPNKPFFHPRKKNLILNGIEGEININNEKKTILYQGLIHPERNLINIASAIRKNKKYQLVLMGKDYNYLKKIKEVNDDIIYLGFINPPNHLSVTSYANIGIINYDYSALNTIFCAPNKIWEYSGFGIPIIGNKLPCLLETIDKYHLGICADMNNSESILKSIDFIEKNYKRLSENSYKYFDSVDLIKTIKHLINYYEKD